MIVQWTFEYKYLILKSGFIIYNYANSHKIYYAWLATDYKSYNKLLSSHNGSRKNSIFELKMSMSLFNDDHKLHYILWYKSMW